MVENKTRIKDTFIMYQMYVNYFHIGNTECSHKISIANFVYFTVQHHYDM